MVFLCLFQTVNGVRWSEVFGNMGIPDSWLNLECPDISGTHAMYIPNLERIRKTHLAQEDKIRQALIIGNWTNFEKAFQSMLET